MTSFADIVRKHFGTDWSKREVNILRRHYRAHGIGACAVLMPYRSHDAIRIKAHEIGVAEERDKLNPMSARVIRDLYFVGKLKQHELGRMFGLRQSSVSRIISGQTWGHIQ